MRSTKRALPVLLPLTLAIFAACGDEAIKPVPASSAEPVVTCDPTAQGMTAFAASDVAVSFETGGDASLALVSADVGKYLGQLWGSSFPVSASAPDFSKKLTLWFSTSAAAQAQASLGSSTYAILRNDSADGTTLTVAARDAAGLSAGSYALLELLGARFFHPKQELVPSFGSPHVPPVIQITRTPSMPSIGIQFHTLHPIEYMPVFNIQSDQNLADAKLVIDWLVKTGQNYLQWALLDISNTPSFASHAAAIIAYAHSRGVRVGANVQTFAGSSLQNNFVLVQDPTNWQPEMDAQLDILMALPWDQVELALGEFISADAQTTIDWLNHAVSYVIGAHPNVEVSVQNHVGNYPDLFVPYQGKTVYFYELPQFADPRLGQSVHTLSFFDVYRDWGTYKEPNFRFQHDYAMQELPTRRVKYFPESAYWISADIDVPLFLPFTLVARWNDIHGLVDEATAKGLAFEGHLQFSSGHEWGYWLTDYLTAKMVWQADASLGDFTADFARAFGSCADDITSELNQLIAIQNHYLFDMRLAAYLQGENATVDTGNIIGNETHPNRIPFETVLAMEAGDREQFQSSFVAPLDAMAAELVPLEQAIAARCRGGGPTLTSWCNELWDGTSILRNRAQHASALYKSILARAAGQDPEVGYKAATALVPEAAAIIARRESEYRFPASTIASTNYTNPTIYAFGYLQPVHTHCYWRRAEMQVRALLDTGIPAGLAQLPFCQGD